MAYSCQLKLIEVHALETFGEAKIVIDGSWKTRVVI